MAIYVSGFFEFVLLFLGIYLMQEDSTEDFIVFADRLISIFVFLTNMILVLSPQVQLQDSGAIVQSALPLFLSGPIITVFSVLTMVAIARTFVVFKLMMLNGK